jgi:cobalt/nickel transport system ATP-binding protein
MKAIEIIDLSFQYKNKCVLSNLSLDIYQQEKVGIIGANGAGKTTFFFSICGLLKINKGEIKLFNQVIKDGSFYPEIGLVFQNPDDQLFCPTVRDDIIFGVENLGLSSAEIDNRLEQVLQSTGVKHLLERIPYQLSGGEKCMVAIASVLIMNPKIILYDEPSANLDLKARRKLINFLKSSEQTILVSSHDLELIVEVCDRVIVMNSGKIVADGNPLEIMSNPRLMEENNLEISPSLKKFQA